MGRYTGKGKMKGEGQKVGKREMGTEGSRAHPKQKSGCATENNTRNTVAKTHKIKLSISRIQLLTVANLPAGINRQWFLLIMPESTTKIRNKNLLKDAVEK